MHNFNKPNLVISKCLEFDKCRYNGQMIPAEIVRKLRPHVNFLPVCPEVEIGLGIPRDPVKLVEEKGKLQMVQPSTNKDLTAKMHRFTKNYLGGLSDIDGFILKFGSPSCGLFSAKIYPRKDNPIPIRKGSGLFGAEVLNQYPDLAIEDEGRLTNFRIREHFLTKLFLFARFRAVKKSGSFKQLVEFQTSNKLLFMAYSQKHMRALGRVIGTHDKRAFDKAVSEYEICLKQAFRHNAKYVSHINVLMHAMGYFKNYLSANEKRYYLNMLDKYRSHRIPLSALLGVLESWIIKYDIEYLATQTYFCPYPPELVEITDSGKGRDY